MNELARRPHTASMTFTQAGREHQEQIDDVIDVIATRLAIGRDADTGSPRLVMQFHDAGGNRVTVALPLEEAATMLDRDGASVATARDPDVASLVRDITHAPLINSPATAIGHQAR